jgi:hypothetical protein
MAVEAQTITVDRIDELTAFLPLFEAEAREYVTGCGGGEAEADGTWIIAYPIYADDVVRFFWLAGQPWWSDVEYAPAKAAELLGDDTFIEQASLAEIKSMLTYCVRGERFGDGHWAAMLESGRISALLRRLVVLRQSLDEREANRPRLDK